MQKIFNFVEKNKLWFALGFFILLLVCYFVPTNLLVRNDFVTNTTDVYPSSASNFYNVFSSDNKTIYSILFAVLQILLFIFIGIFFANYFIKSNISCKISNCTFSAICILQILDLIFLIIDMIYIQNITTTNYYSYNIVPYIGFYFYCALTIFSIIYLVTFITKRLQYHYLVESK